MPELAHILVGDHLGQVKKILIGTNEVSSLDNCAEPNRLNPVVSIEPLGDANKQLIANLNGRLSIYDPVHDRVEPFASGDDNLIKALPIRGDDVFLVYDKRVTLARGNHEVLRHKRGEIKSAKANLRENQLAVAGKDISLKVYDINSKTKIFEGEPPEKDWLGIQPETFVSGLDFVGKTRIVTCSKSDSVIRIYDPQAKTKPVISANLNQEAFNEHGEAGRFMSVASASDDGRSIVVGSNVGQMMALDLRFNVKITPKKKLQTKPYKVLGSFKGSRGASIKDIKLIPATSLPSDKLQAGSTGDEYFPSEGNDSYKVISCGLDRFVRIHNFSKNSRYMVGSVYMKTKPHCCSPVFFRDVVSPSRSKKQTK